MSEAQSTKDDGRSTPERSDERAKWTKDIAEMFRGFTKDPDYQAYLKAADFLDPQPSDAMVVIHGVDAETVPGTEPTDAEPNPIAYLLWSNKHNAWWAPAMRGYTDNIDLAGRYDENTAAGLVVQSAQCGIRTQVTCMVAAPDNWAVSA